MDIDVKVQCFECQAENKHCTVVIVEDKNEWHWKRGRYPHGWSLEDEAELNFYNTEGNLCDFDEGEAIVFGRCSKCRGK